MPNQRSLDVTDYKIRMSRQRYHACKAAAQARGISTQEFMRDVLRQATAGDRQILTQKEAAALLGVCDWTLRVWWPRKGLHPPRITRWRRLLGYDREQLLEWAAREFGRTPPATQTREGNSTVA